MKKTAALLLLLAAAVSPAAADWLVTRTGEKVETKGPWQLKGKLVVFTRMDGTLASVRASELDLEASGRATAEARAKKDAPPPAAATPEKKKPVAVVTNETLAKSKKPAATPAAAPAGEEARPAEEPASTGPAVLVSWDRRALPEGNGIELYGTLRNPGNKIAAGVLVRVQLYDETGGLVASAEGIPAQSSISPQGTVEFRIPFPGIYAFGEAKLQVKSFELDFDPAPKEGETPE